MVASVQSMQARGLTLRAGLWLVTLLVVVAWIFPASCVGRWGAWGVGLLLGVSSVINGDYLLRWLMPHFRGGPTLHVGLALACGWGVLSLLIQVLAVIGTFTPLMCGLLTTVWLGTACVLSTPEIERRFKCGLGLLSLTAPRSGSSRVAKWLTLMVVFWTVLWAGGPIWDYDSEAYHLPVAREFLKQAGLIVSAENPLWNYPLLGSLWAGMTLMLGWPQAAAVLMCLAAGGITLLTDGLCRRGMGQTAATWAVPIFWSGPIVTMVAATPRVEPLCAFYLLAAVILMAERFGQNQPFSWGEAVCAGMWLGLAASLKYQALYGWFVLGVWAALRWLLTPRLRTMRHFLWGLLIIGTALAVSAPWWGKNAVAFGNPFYPFLQDPQRPSPWWCMRYLAGTEYDRAPSDVEPVSLLRPLTQLGSLWMNPHRGGDPPWHWPHYAFLLLLLMPFALPPPPLRELAAVGACYVLVGVTISPVQRHLFGTYPLLSVAVASVLVAVGQHYRKARVAGWLIVGCLLMSALLPARLVHLPWLARYLVAWDDEQVLRRRLLGSLPDAERWLQTQVQPNDRVLLCWESRTFRLPGRAIVDPGGKNWFTLLAQGREHPEQVQAFLQEQGIRYLLVHEGTLRYHVIISHEIPSAWEEVYRQQQALLVGTALITRFDQQGIMIFEVQTKPLAETRMP